MIHNATMLTVSVLNFSSPRSRRRRPRSLPRNLQLRRPRSPQPRRPSPQRRPLRSLQPRRPPRNHQLRRPPRSQQRRNPPQRSLPPRSHLRRRLLPRRPLPRRRQRKRLHPRRLQRNERLKRLTLWYSIYPRNLIPFYKDLYIWYAIIYVALQRLYIAGHTIQQSFT